MVQFKSSSVKKLRKQLAADFPNIAPVLPEILPKKSVVYSMRLKENDKCELIIVENNVIFITHFKRVFPSLKTLQKYPFILTQQRVDRGAIKFVMNGADIMCPGFTSEGGHLNEAHEDQVVAIMAEGKQHPFAVGLMKLSSARIQEVNKGVGVLNLHFLGDALWHLTDFRKK